MSPLYALVGIEPEGVCFKPGVDKKSEYIKEIVIAPHCSSDYIDVKETRFISEMSHARTDLNA